MSEKQPIGGILNIGMDERKKESLPTFVEVPVTGKEPVGCVDGRPDYSKEPGAQMLGGSLLPILLHSVSTGEHFDEPTIVSKLNDLTAAGFAPGAHRGHHKHEEGGTCDCGFADKLPTILQRAKDQRAEIASRLNGVYQEQKATIGEFSLPFRDIVERSFDRLEQFPHDALPLTGEALVAKVEEHGAQIADMEGDHAERVAYVNLKPGTTLDTNAFNQAGKQAFNFDLWAAVEQAEALKVDPEFAIASSLILYVATEMVLVEDKGKPALPVVIHS